MPTFGDADVHAKFEMMHIGNSTKAQCSASCLLSWQPKVGCLPASLRP